MLMGGSLGPQVTRRVSGGRAFRLRAKLVRKRGALV